MKRTTLCFPSVHLLWQFRLETGIPQCSIDTTTKAITCLCTSEHLQLAITKFKAHLESTAPTLSLLRPLGTFCNAAHESVRKITKGWTKKNAVKEAV